MPGEMPGPGEPTWETASVTLYLVDPVGNRYAITTFAPGERPEVAHVDDGAHPRAQAQSLDACHALGARAGHHALLAARDREASRARGRLLLAARAPERLELGEHRRPVRRPHRRILREHPPDQRVERGRRVGPQIAHPRAVGEQDLREHRHQVIGREREFFIVRVPAAASRAATIGRIAIAQVTLIEGVAPTSDTRLVRDLPPPPGLQVFVYDETSPEGRPLKTGDPVEGGGNHGTLVDIQWQVATAWVLYAEGKYDDALKAMSAAADAEDKTDKHPVTPGVPTPARELYGTMLLERGMAKEALAAFEATLKKEPNRLGATLGAGAAAEKSGDSAKARARYAAAVALTGNADPVRAQIAQARAFVAQSAR